MAGYLQIVIYMLCVYFVLKGVEIFQIGLTSKEEHRKLAMTIGVIAVIVSIAAAAGFFIFEEYWSYEFSKQTQNPFK